MRVKFFAYIREHTRSKVVEVAAKDCPSVMELIQYLCNSYGDGLCSLLLDGEKISSEIVVLVNGRHIEHLQQGDTLLTDNDEVSIFPVVAGG